MSKSSKNARKIALRKVFSQTRKNGGKGPARTNPVHGKKNAWWQKKVSTRPQRGLSNAESDGT